MPRFKVGDVVFAEGASAILGDVIAAPEDPDGKYDIQWRSTLTSETADDLHLVREEDDA